jgi:hypothetical protein
MQMPSQTLSVLGPTVLQGPQSVKGTLNVTNGYYLNGVPLGASLNAPGQYLIADDTSNDDGFCPGNQNLPAIGRMTQLAINGRFIGQYALSVYAPTGEGAGQFAGAFQGALTSGQSSGIVVYGGTTATDTCVNFLNSSGTIEYFEIWGDGHGSLATGMTWDVNGAFTIATPTSNVNALSLYGKGGNFSSVALYIYCSAASNCVGFSDGTNASGFVGFDTNHNMQVGSLTASYGLELVANAANAMFVYSTNCISAGALGAKGATPAVTANQTDIGTTTTTTVISTTGGVLMTGFVPSTVWVVNVNGVKYGVPCFAL